MQSMLRRPNCRIWSSFPIKIKILRLSVVCFPTFKSSTQKPKLWCHFELFKCIGTKELHSKNFSSQLASNRFVDCPSFPFEMAEPVSVDDFIQDTLKDIQSPAESEFGAKISSIRQTVHSLDEVLTILCGISYSLRVWRPIDPCCRNPASLSKVSLQLV